MRFLNSYTGKIILANIILFVAFFIASFFIDSETLFSNIALKPATILSGEKLWTIVTSMFMHGNFTHLFLNLVSLWFIGLFVERLIGKKRFIYVYFGAGLFAGLLFILVAYFFNIDMNVYAVGASGAIFGLGGLLAILTPRLPVLVFFVIPMPMWMAMIALLGILWIFSLGLDIPIGNVAHLGGLLLGVAYGLYLKYKYPRKTQMISKYFSR